MMKKQMQQPRVKTGLCVRRYLGNSSEIEVTIVSMVANWNSGRRGASETNRPTRKVPKVLRLSHDLHEVWFLGLHSPDGSKGLCWGPTHKVSKGNPTGYEL